jgi:phosphotriesterase-related protein
MVDFIGAATIQPGRYDPSDVFAKALPKLREVQALGCVRLQECTPNYIGRDARLLKRLTDASGLDIWTNTGLYAAANHKFLPKYAFERTAEELAREWIAEYQRGVDGVKPRFIKIGVNKGPLHEVDRKIVSAGAITCRETGLTLASHTGDGRAAMEQLEILESNRVQPSKFVWVHAHNEKDHAFHERAARSGAWVEFDGLRAQSADWHRECIQFMQSRDLLSRTLVSQDSGWYRVGEPGGGNYRSYAYIYTDFLPRFSDQVRKTLMVDNPRVAFGK